jgi:capsular exopolysaccharide synthesis family protein
MSKVHEALKRAQEEWSSASQAVGGGSRQYNGKANATIAAVAPEVGGSESARVNLQPQSMPADSALPVTAVSKVPLVASPSEHRPHTPAAGRDPRTGQFLRFEDLLKSCANPTWVVDPRTVAFSGTNEASSGAEQFRTLRSRLYNLRETTQLKRVLITSALASEGKTFVATNLAQAITKERERKVLLIDGDLRSPALHKPLGAPCSPGLSDYLRGQASDPEIIQHGQEGNLCFIAAGSPGSDPSELLSNGLLEKLLDRLAPLFDWVIIDSPPCLPVADANLLAGHCDGVLLVLRAKSTPSAAADKARKELQKRKVIGVVMNGVEQANTYGGYYGYSSAASGNGSMGLKLS